MPILDQYGNEARVVEPTYDINDPLVAAAWGRKLEAETAQPSMFDDPRLVNERGEPVTTAAPGARLSVYFGSVLDGCPLVRVEEDRDV